MCTCFVFVRDLNVMWMPPYTTIMPLLVGVYLCFSDTILWLTCVVVYRRQQEAETKIIEEQTAKRVQEAIRKKVHEALHSEELRKEVELKIQEGRKKIFDDIAAQLEREKEDALAEARRKEVWPETSPSLASTSTPFHYMWARPLSLFRQRLYVENRQ